MSVTQRVAHFRTPTANETCIIEVFNDTQFDGSSTEFVRVNKTLVMNASR